MSLENQVVRVAQGTKDTLKTLINKFGGNISDELIDQYPELVEELDINVDGAQYVIEHNADADAHEDIRQAIANIPQPDVAGKIATHDADTDAHEDIRALIDIKIETAFANIAKAEEASF